MSHACIINIHYVEWFCPKRTKCQYILYCRKWMFIVEYSESNVEIYRTPVQLQGWCRSLLPYLAPNWSVPHMVTIFLFLTVSCANSHYIRHQRGYPNSHTVIISISLFLGIWIGINDPLPCIIYNIYIYILLCIS